MVLIVLETKETSLDSILHLAEDTFIYENGVETR